MKSKIENVKFSPDARFFTTLHSEDKQGLIVWDFLTVNTEGDILDIPHKKLEHPDLIISYKFRGNHIR
jgi:hypothetical protein